MPRLLSGGESHQTRKGVYLVPQGIEVYKSGSMLALAIVKEYYFTFIKVSALPRPLGVAFAPDRTDPRKPNVTHNLRNL